MSTFSTTSRCAPGLATPLPPPCQDAACRTGVRSQVVFGLTITSGRIVQIDMLADVERLRRLDLVLLDA
jgi:hypothetical protein